MCNYFLYYSRQTLGCSAARQNEARIPCIKHIPAPAPSVRRLPGFSQSLPTNKYYLELDHSRALCISH